MTRRIASTCFLVEGISTDREVKDALQKLYDVFASHGLGQATFEIVDGEPARLWVKHTADVEPSPELIGDVLKGAGDYRVVGVEKPGRPAGH